MHAPKPRTYLRAASLALLAADGASVLLSAPWALTVVLELAMAAALAWVLFVPSREQRRAEDARRALRIQVEARLRADQAMLDAGMADQVRLLHEQAERLVKHVGAR